MNTQTATTSSLYDYILSNLEHLPNVELNSLLQELEIKHLTDVLAYRFPEADRASLEAALVQHLDCELPKQGAINEELTPDKSPHVPRKENR